MIGTVFTIIFYKPLYNALVFLLGIIPGHNVGIAVIVLTLVVQFILFPFRHKSVIAQRKMKEIEPEIHKIKEQFKKDKQEQTRQIMALYRSHGVSPFSGFLMLLIQLPVFFALYRSFAIQRTTNRVNYPTNKDIAYRHLGNPTGAPHLIPFLNTAVVTKDNGSYTVFLQIHSNPDNLIRKLK